MSRARIRFPFGGLSDNTASGDQPQGTSNDALNVRGQDPVTGQVRGAQRSGTEKYLSSMLSASAKVATLAVTVSDERNVDYSAATPGSEETIASGDVEGTVLNLKVDRGGNAYYLANNKVVKVNRTGTVVWTLGLPVEDTTHICRALWIDSVDNVYAAVSGGGNQVTARVWKYEQLQDATTQQVFELELGLYVEAIRVDGDNMYLACNGEADATAFLMSYIGLDSASPVRDWKARDNIQFPIRGMDYYKGSLYVATGAYGSTLANRQATDDQGPASCVDQNALQLSRTKKGGAATSQSLWAHYRAEDIEESDLVGTELKSGAQILTWRDSSGNDRDLTATIGYDSEDTPPTYLTNGPGRRPTVHFNGKNNGFVSQSANNNDRTSLDSTLTSLPTYSDAVFHVFIVARLPVPTDTETGTGSTNVKAGTIFYAQNEDPAKTGDYFGIFANRAVGDPLNTNAVSGGILSVYDDTAGNTTPATGTSSHPLGGSHDNDLDTVVIHYTFSGNQPNASAIFRVNGSTVEVGYDSDDFSMTGDSVYVGRTESMVGLVDSAEKARLSGDISEILIFRGVDNSGADEPFFDTDSTANFNADLGADIEGYLHFKYGVYNLIDSGHPYGAGDFGPPPNGAAAQQLKTISSKPYLAKYGADKGRFIWAVNEDNSDQTQGGGYGLGVAVSKSGYVYSWGAAQGAGTTRVRRIVDLGESADLDATGTWESNFGPGTHIANQGALNPFGDTFIPRAATDKFDNLYLAGGLEGTRVYTPSGTLITVGSYTTAYTIAVDPDIPEYGTDLTDKVAERVYVGFDSATSPNRTAIALVDKGAATGSPRSFKYVGVSDGDVQTFTSGGVSMPTGYAFFTGGGGISQYFHSATHFQKVYITDGLKVAVYDPTEDTVEALKATSAGSVPERPKIVESWRGRLVLARFAGEPNQWAMSAISEPLDWDFYPPTRRADAAVLGSLARAGLMPDIVNGFIPATDDVAIMGGDHSMWQLTGDPQDGGQIDLLSDVTGMAFGRAWAKTPEGAIIFMGSRGGLYRLVPGQVPQRLTLNTVERRLQAIDFSSYYVVLAYNYEDEGINIFQCPFGAGGTQVKHWFFELKTGALWEDEFSNTDVQPTAALVVDADSADDRVLLLGCEDGYVRRWSKSARDDDGNAINSYVTIGPLASSEVTREMKFYGLTMTLAKDSDPVRYELFQSEEPDSLGQPVHTGILNGGRNPRHPDRMRGSACWVRLRNAVAGQRWAMEEGFMDVNLGGRKRVRS